MARKSRVQKHRLSEEQPRVRFCMWPDCPDPGEHPAPRQRTVPESFADNHHHFAVEEDQPQKDRYWFCLEHVRRYNREWNFFDGMNEDEIFAFQQDALTGHRRTAPISQHLHAKVEEAYEQAATMRTGRYTQKEAPKKDPPSTEREAMKVLELTYPLTAQKLKLHYRRLVKACHPDHHGKEGEERLKIINEAYTLLKVMV